MSGGLMDVAQSASNAVAGNVSGPVDLLAFLLRKAGVPVPEDPVGGTEWMRRKGLIRDVPQGAAQVAGETLGLLAPVTVALKAPTIAGGLLTLSDDSPREIVGLSARQRGMAIDPTAKRRLVSELRAGKTNGEYRLGDVTPGQARALAELAGAELPKTGDVMLTPDAFRHILKGRVQKDGFLPHEVGDVAEKALQARSSAFLDLATQHQAPSLINRDVLDAATGKRYDAVAALRPDDDAFRVVTIVPDRLPAPKKKPRQR